jgi:Ni,Fe-hydrogenase III small subunit
MGSRARIPKPSLFKTVLRRARKVFFWLKPTYTETLPGENTRQGSRRSVFIRVVDCGSSNAAEQEILAIFNPVYDAERLGFRLVASPRHADLLLVTGPITRNMQAALLAAFRAMPEPRRVITVGDDLGSTSIFNRSYAVVPLPEEVAAALIAHIPGDPPSPEQILQALIQAV